MKIRLGDMNGWWGTITVDKDEKPVFEGDKIKIVKAMFDEFEDKYKVHGINVLKKLLEKANAYFWVEEVKERQKLLDRLAKIEDSLLIYWDDYGVPFGESCVLTADGIFTLSCMYDYAGPFFFTTRDYNTAKKRLEKGLDWDKEKGDGDGEFAKVIDLVKAGCLAKTECYQFQRSIEDEPNYYENEDDVRDAFANEVMAFNHFRLWEKLSTTELRKYCKWADHLEYDTPLTLIIKT